MVGAAWDMSLLMGRGGSEVDDGFGQRPGIVLTYRRGEEGPARELGLSVLSRFPPGSAPLGLMTLALRNDFCPASSSFPLLPPPNVA